MVTLWVALADPQLNEETVYEIVAVPGVPPVTTPETSTEAIDEFALLQTPPTAASASEIAKPEHTLSSPTIIPVSGNAFTVTL